MDEACWIALYNTLTWADTPADGTVGEPLQWQLHRNGCACYSYGLCPFPPNHI